MGTLLLQPKIDSAYQAVTTPPTENPGVWSSVKLGYEQSWNQLYHLLSDVRRPPTQDSIAYTNALNYEVNQGNGVGNFVGQALQFATNPLNWMSDGISGLASKGILKFLPETIAKNAFFKAGITAGRATFDFLPQDVANNYNVATQKVNWAGTAEDAGIAGGISLIIPAMVGLRGLIKNRAVLGNAESELKSPEPESVNPENFESMNQSAVDQIKTLHPGS